MNVISRQLQTNKKYLISVIVVTYNSDKDKLFFTLNSVIKQKNIDFEIIISDDGSTNPLSNEIEEYFNKKKFYDYKIILHKNNGGTVKNCFDGIKQSTGKYIKTISPGDALSNENILNRWVIALEKSGRKWAFGDVIYYYVEAGKRSYLKKQCLPQLVDCYIKKDDKTCRWNYLVLDDIIMGLAIICDRVILLEYLKILVGKVIYAEDMAYRLMMYDGIVPHFFHDNVVVYEYGSGISTCGDDTWRKRLEEDVDQANSIMFERTNSVDEIQKNVIKVFNRRKITNNRVERVISFFDRGSIKIKVLRRLHPRMSKVPRE